MAVKKQPKKNLSVVEIISEQDDAVDNEAEGTDWEAYRETLDPSKLVIKGSPTVFVCNFDLSAKQAEGIRNSMAGSGGITLGSWSQRVVRSTLKEIRNPPEIPAVDQLILKKNSDGTVHDDTITELERAGIVQEIFNHYMRLVGVGGRANAKN